MMRNGTNMLLVLLVSSHLTWEFAAAKEKASSKAVKEKSKAKKEIAKEKNARNATNFEWSIQNTWCINIIGTRLNTYNIV